MAVYSTDQFSGRVAGKPVQFSFFSITDANRWCSVDPARRVVVVVAGEAGLVVVGSPEARKVN